MSHANPTISYGKPLVHSGTIPLYAGLFLLETISCAAKETHCVKKPPQL